MKDWVKGFFYALFFSLTVICCWPMLLTLIYVIDEVKEKERPGFLLGVQVLWIAVLAVIVGAVFA